MSLRWRIILLLGLVFALLAAITCAVQRAVILPRFAELEQREALDDFERSRQALLHDVDQLATLNSDWASWDDTCGFIGDRNSDYIEANLTPESFKNMHLDLLVYLDLQGQVVWPRSGDTPEIMREAEFRRLLSENPRLKLLPAEDAPVSGLVRSSAGLIMLSARPILSSRNEGPPRGMLIMGRRLEAEEIDALSERTRVDLRLWPIDAAPADVAGFAAAAAEGPQFGVTDNDQLRVFGTCPDLTGEPAVLLQVTLPRKVSQSGRIALRWSLLMTVACGGAVLLLMFYELNRSVVHPLIKVTRHAVETGRREDWQARLGMQRQDEIGTLAAAFDAMISRFHKCHCEMLDIAHGAGMAEIASEVLHNAGNALNSANISAELIQQQLQRSSLPGLGKAVQLLEEHKGPLQQALGDAERGTRLVRYLEALAAGLTDEQREIGDEVQRLRDRIEHVLEIIAMQQACANHAPLVQREPLAGVVEQILRMEAHALSKRGIRVVREYRDAPAVPMEKNRVMQVVLNLVKNAGEALEGRPGERILTARVYRRDATTVAAEIEDNGEGLEPERQGGIFQSGFTTKPQGHGIGLHFCLNAMAAMGGGISFYSPGHGQGARFTLWLPIENHGEHNERTEAGGEPADSHRR